MSKVILPALLLASTLVCEAQSTQAPAPQAATQPATQRAGDQRSREQYLQDCARGIAVDTCVSPPAPRSCPAGQHWTLAGTGIAHCVGDFLPPPPPPSSPNPASCSPSTVFTGVLACPPGDTGTRETYSNTECDAAGNPVALPDTVIDHCVADPAPTTPVCVPGSTVIQTTECPANQTGGPIRRLQIVTCPGNLTQIVTTGTCVFQPVTCTPQTVPNPPENCPAGFTGTMQGATVTTCPAGPYGPPLQTVLPPDTGNCVPVPECPNGAPDYPFCTRSPQLPAPDCPASPGPLDGGAAAFTPFCQGEYGFPAGKFGDTAPHLICGNGSSGCHCYQFLATCTANGWKFYP